MFAPRSLRFASLSLVVGLALGLPAIADAAVDWDKVPAADVAVFYPGQASWEWVMTEKDHSGAPKFREGKNCKSCHQGEQKDMGAKVVKGEKLEPMPPKGKAGSLVLKVQTAHDADRFYVRVRYSAGSGNSGADAKVAARVTVMLDDGSVKEAPRAGCWGSCHDDAQGMASGGDGSRSKYLGASRVKLARSGGGDNVKPAADLATLMAGGVFLEYLQARLNPGQPAVAASGYILDARHEDAGAVGAAEASFANGEWTVVLSRPLTTTAPGHKSIVAGKTYLLGFAVHDEHADHRHHFVSFENSLVLDAGTADFVAKAQ